MQNAAARARPTNAPPPARPSVKACGSVSSSSLSLVELGHTVGKGTGSLDGKGNGPAVGARVGTDDGAGTGAVVGSGCGTAVGSGTGLLGLLAAKAGAESASASALETSTGPASGRRRSRTTSRTRRSSSTSDSTDARTCSLVVKRNWRTRRRKATSSSEPESAAPSASWSVAKTAESGGAGLVAGSPARSSRTTSRTRRSSSTWDSTESRTCSLVVTRNWTTRRRKLAPVLGAPSESWSATQAASGGAGSAPASAPASAPHGRPASSSATARCHRPAPGWAVWLERRQARTR